MHTFSPSRSNLENSQSVNPRKYLKQFVTNIILHRCNHRKLLDSLEIHYSSRPSLFRTKQIVDATKVEKLTEQSRVSGLNELWMTMTIANVLTERREMMTREPDSNNNVFVSRLLTVQLMLSAPFRCN